MSLYEYNAKVKRIVDGDTVDAYVDLGFKTHLEIRIRLKGIDTPESRTRDLIEKRYGLGAKKRITDYLEGNENNFVLKSSGVGKYGRCLGELFVPGPELEDGVRMISINQRLINEGHAVPYFGGSKLEVKEALMLQRDKSKEYVEKHIKPLD
jgi:micrococcal nuclease